MKILREGIKANFPIYREVETPHVKLIFSCSYCGCMWECLPNECSLNTYITVPRHTCNCPCCGTSCESYSSESTYD